MPPTFSLNTEKLHAAAAKADHVHDSGEMNLYAISKHAGLDRASLSRVVRDENGPDLGTVVELAAAYGLRIEDLIVRRRTPRPRRHRAKRHTNPIPDGRAA
ncbi:helix-turn-helix domain-containing protein [Kitasatospora sp. NPDC059408]|uniref:helix-turn-helix domain-containing protein n=1 Tax=Kitasatospora sp. NPDC059408 TaxID=3346823 RepID=UPI0036B660F8